MILQVPTYTLTLEQRRELKSKNKSWKTFLKKIMKKDTRLNS